MSDRELFIVEVDGFKGERSRIDVWDTSGALIRAIYCIAARSVESGVSHLIDYRYQTLEEAQQATPSGVPPVLTSRNYVSQTGLEHESSGVHQIQLAPTCPPRR